MRKQLSILLFTTLGILSLDAQQSDFNSFENLFTPPKNYVVPYTNQSIVIDGNINDAAWDNTTWTDAFEDIEGDLKPKPYYATRAKMLWDDNYLYIAAEMEEENVWAYLDQHDQVVFFDNDFEVFIDPSNTTHHYFEIEINALNNIFDLFLPKPYREGSGALISWGGEGLKHAVQIYGSLNNPNDKDQGWTIEMAIPFKDITIGNDPNVPKDGDIWKLNFSRVQWETEVKNGKYVKKKDTQGKDLPENNWVWSPQGVINMHLPERWGYIQFSKKEKQSELPLFAVPYTEKQKEYLWLIYYKQKEYKSKNGAFAKTLKALDIDSNPIIDNSTNILSMESTSNQFEATINKKGDSKKITINTEGLISQ